MNKPSTPNRSRPVTRRHAMSLTEQNRTGQNRTEPLSTRGGGERLTRRLSEYLDAPAHVQEAFDRQVRGRVAADCDLDRWSEWEIATDYIAARVTRNRANLSAALGLEPPASTVEVTWDERWSKRASRPAPRPGDPATYSIATDPLLLRDLRETWPLLTGEDVPRWGRVTCPSPDHDDRRPDCAVFHDGFKCFACGAKGSILDLGGFLYGLAPRGADFFRIRERLLDDLGMAA